jgi:hypothetical protein
VVAKYAVNNYEFFHSKNSVNILEHSVRREVEIVLDKHSIVIAGIQVTHIHASNEGFYLV